MLKTFLFLLKAGLFIGALIWLSEQEGSVKIDWMNYSINAHVGLFLAGLLCLIVLSIFIYRVIRTVFDFPSSYRYYSQNRAKNLGYKSLTLGLTAVAAGDGKAALKHAEKARALLPEDKGLPYLLEAQAARMDGREGDAQVSFAALLENKDTSFLGVRGLLQSSLDAGDTDSALDLARHALKLHPKQPWILRTVYDLEIGARAWSDAGETLKRAVKAGAITKERAVSDRVAMALAIALSAEEEGLHDVAEAQYKDARKMDAFSVPSIVLAAEYYVRQRQPKKARALIEKTWKKLPHAALVDVWAGLMPDGDNADALARIRWFEKLVKINPANARVQVAAGMAAFDAALWGEARKFFEAAEAIRPSKELYVALAALEDKTSGHEEAAREWLAKAADVKGARVWICRESGRIYDAWSPIAQPHGGFNTIEWNYPYVGAQDDEPVLLTVAANVEPMDDTLIEAPERV